MSRRRSRGFSLMELVVALAINALVLTVAVALFERIAAQGSAARQRAELERDAALAQSLLERELRQAGLGVPRDRHAASDAVLRPVLVATSTSIGILADFARPDAQYPTLGMLSTQLSLDGVSPPDTHLWWFTENNGPCQPDGTRGSGPRCSTATTSVFFPGQEGCGVSGAASDRTCPWGLRRVLPGEALEVVYGNGRWATSTMRDPISLHGGGTHSHDLMFVELAHPLDNWNIDATVVDPGSMPRANVGTGFVVTLDRVFFAVRGNVLTRQQCWGTPAPDLPQWPADGAIGIPADPTYADGERTSVCTDVEVIARDVRSFQLRYFSADGLEVDGTAPESIARITYHLVLVHPTSGVRHEVEGSVLLRNQRGV